MRLTMSVVSNVKVKFAPMAYSRRQAELTYGGMLTISDRTYNLADISRTKFGRRGSAVDVKLLFTYGAKLVLRFYGESAFLVTNKGVGHEEASIGDSQDVQFARLFGRLLANDQQPVGFDDSLTDASFDLTSFDESRYLEDGDFYLETPIRAERELFGLPTVREFPVDDFHVQEGCKDIDYMIKYILREISVPEEVVLSWLPGLITTETS